MTTARLYVLAAALLAGGCGGGPNAPRAEPAEPFAYDASAPLDATTRELADEGGVRSLDVSYASEGSGRARAYLLEPSAGGDGPPVVYLHGGGGGRADLLPVAVGWVRSGGRALLVDAARERAATTPVGRLRAARAAEIATVIRIRRGVDFLGAERVGFVGWSAGARTGAIVAAVEPRIDALVLMAGGALPLERYAEQAPEELRDDVRSLLADVDPLRHVARARPDTILFQNGRRDEVVPAEALRALAAAARRPQEVRWYDAGHPLSAAAWEEQHAWLRERLR